MQYLLLIQSLKFFFDDFQNRLDPINLSLKTHITRYLFQYLKKKIGFNIWKKKVYFEENFYKFNHIYIPQSDTYINFKLAHYYILIIY